MSLPASPEQRGQQAAATPCTPCTPCTPSTPQVAPRAAVELDAGWAPREGVRLQLGGKDAERLCVRADSVLTDSDCAQLMRCAEGGAGYEAALLNVGAGRQVMAADVRNSERSIVDDVPLAAQLFERVRHLLPAEIWVPPAGRERFGGAMHYAMPDEAGGTVAALEAQGWRRWELCALNERLRFLRYGAGHYFREHSDGAYWRPGSDPYVEGEGSFLTLQFYLKAPEGGGQTSFTGAAVESVPGRVCIFDHDCLHAGEAVTGGEKVVIRTDVMYRQ